MNTQETYKDSISLKFSQSLNKSITIILLVFSVPFISYQVYDYLESSKSRLAEIAALAKTSLPYSMWNMDNSAMEEVVKTLTLGKDLVYVALIMEGDLISEHHSDKKTNKKFQDYQDSFFYLSVAEKISYEKKEIGEVQIVISQRGLFSQFLLNTAVLYLFAIILIRLIRSRSDKISRKFVFEPLIFLEQKATQIASGDLETKLEIKSQDEIGSLSASLDKMRLSIITLFEDLKKINLQLEEHNLNLEQKVTERTLELQENNKKLDIALKKQEILNENILDSIQYAKLIQNSILPSIDTIKENLPDSCCYWHPKDIVGGDIYFFEKIDDKLVFAIIDCTGHGVPGAFMTMIAATSIKTIISSKQLNSPGKILSQLNSLVKKSLRQDEKNSQSDDGLDMGICIIDKKSNTLHFSGAKTALFYTENDEVLIIKGDKESIGYKGETMSYIFTDHRVHYHENTHFYLTTDGMLDQKGGEKGLPFGKRRFFKTLMEVQHLPLEQQKTEIFNYFDAYADGFDHQDDITFIGFRPAK